MDKVELLQLILEGLHVNTGYDEAQEIGSSLVEFFEALAEKVDDEFID